MDFALTEEQEELQGLARQILEDRMDLAHLKARDFSEEWYDRDTWAEFAKANLLGIALPESAGGLGFGFLDQCFVLREIGRTVAPLPAIPTLVAAGLPIARFGTEAQQAVLPKIVSGDVLLTAALVELGAEPDRPVTTATRDGDGWRIDGVKSNVPGAHVAEAVLVPAARGRRRRDAHRPDEHAGHHAHAPGDHEPRAVVRDAARRGASSATTPGSVHPNRAARS